MSRSSFSETLQSSLMVRPDLTVVSEKYRQPKINKQHKQHPLYEQQQNPIQLESSRDEVGIAGMFVLVVAMSSVEACMAFENAYLILILQYLGTPESLLSIGGVLTGATSLIIMPGISFYANGGKNTWKRKWYTIIIGLGVFLLGLTFVITAGVIKITNVSQAFQDELNPMNLSTRTLFSNSSRYNGSSVTSFESNRIPVTAILGILGFALTDMAYDVSTPVVKSFALDTLPQSQHTAVLAISTILQSIGGTTITLIGIFDLPTVIGSTFGVDGIAGTLLLLCGTLYLAMLLCFSATLMSGHIIGGWMGKRRNTDQDIKINGKETMNNLDRHDRFQYQRLSESSTKSTSYALGLSRTDTRASLVASTEGDNHPWKSDSSLSEERRFLNPTGEDRNAYMRSHNTSYGGTNKIEVCASGNDCTQTSSDSLSSKLGTSEPPRSDRQAIKLYLKNKRIIITCICGFFANGCLLCFSIYSPNALTIGIYKGDPLALPGTPGRAMYEKGLRHGTLGVFLVYISTFISSIFQHKAMKTIGEKPYFLIICTVVAISIATFAGTQSMESFVVAMAIFGSFRSCCLTVPFVIVSKIVSEEISDNGSADGKTLGGAISLLGMMMPGHYLVLSSAMGPLIDLTGNVWVPVIYSLVVLVASAACLVLLYYVRHQKK